MLMVSPSAMHPLARSRLRGRKMVSPLLSTIYCGDIYRSDIQCAPGLRLQHPSLEMWHIVLPLLAQAGAQPVPLPPGARGHYGPGAKKNDPRAERKNPRASFHGGARGLRHQDQQKTASASSPFQTFRSHIRERKNKAARRRWSRNTLARGGASVKCRAADQLGSRSWDTSHCPIFVARSC
jgi:hypothetical protein